MKTLTIMKEVLNLKSDPFCFKQLTQYSKIQHD